MRFASIATFSALPILLVFSGAAYGDSMSDAAKARRDQLAKVQEMLSDPDPLMREANMEQIIKSGDSTLIRVAEKIAFASDDQELRALAMRGYLASTKELVFEIKFPEELQKQYEEVKGDPQQLAALAQKKGQFISEFQNLHMSLVVKVSQYDMKSNIGIISQSTWSDGKGEFTVVGDTVNGQMRYSFDGPGSGVRLCQVMFKPTRELKLAGTLGCDLGLNVPTESISASLF